MGRHCPTVFEDKTSSICVCEIMKANVITSCIFIHWKKKNSYAAIIAIIFVYLEDNNNKNSWKKFFFICSGYKNKFAE